MTETSDIEGRHQRPDWNVFDEWNLVVSPAAERASAWPQPRSSGHLSAFGSDWIAVDALVSAFAGIARTRAYELSKLLDEWDRLLAPFGGDPTRSDWRRFRPLRLSREEDWSDWLAYVIESSETGLFCSLLLGDSTSTRSDYAKPPHTEREVTHSECRADLIVQWITGSFTHIEVKVGDPNLAKTFETGRLMRKRYRQPPERWRNYILLLSRQIPDWGAVSHDVSGEPSVEPLTWDAVCVALRRALLSNENMLWKVFAYTLVGAIEQRLVGYRGFSSTDRPVENIDAKIRILQEGLKHG